MPRLECVAYTCAEKSECWAQSGVQVATSTCLYREREILGHQRKMRLTYLYGDGIALGQNGARVLSASVRIVAECTSGGGGEEVLGLLRSEVQIYLCEADILGQSVAWDSFTHSYLCFFYNIHH